MGPRIRTAALVLGTAVAVTAMPVLAGTTVDYAKNAGHLRGYPRKAFQMACAQGTVAGFAQVPGDVGKGWTEVGGFGTSVFSVGPSRPGAANCNSEPAMAKHVSTGVYEVSLNSSLAWACQMSDVPRAGDTLPAIVTVASASALGATYTTTCDPNDQGWVEVVQVRALDGTPADTAFTLATLEPVQVAEP